MGLVFEGRVSGWTRGIITNMANWVMSRAKPKLSRKWWASSNAAQTLIKFCITTTSAYTGPAVFSEQRNADIITVVKWEMPIPGSDDLWHQYRPPLLPMIPPGCHLSSQQTSTAEAESPTHCPLPLQTLHLETENTKCVSVVYCMCVQLCCCNGCVLGSEERYMHVFVAYVLGTRLALYVYAERSIVVVSDCSVWFLVPMCGLLPVRL